MRREFASYRPLKESFENTDVLQNMVNSCSDGEDEDWSRSQRRSRFLSSAELKALYGAHGHMPPITVSQNVDRVVEQVQTRVDYLDANLHQELQDLFNRISEHTQRQTSTSSWFRSVCWYFRLGIIKEVLPEVVFYCVYSLLVSFYASQIDWETSWTLLKQDVIYYPAVVLSFILCFRASGCMERYKEGLRTSFEMEKALREVAFEVLTNLSIEDGNSSGPEENIRSLRRKYFKHEFRRLVRLLFACAVRDLNDSALEDDELDEEEAAKIPVAMTGVEHAAIMVTHSSLGHAFRVYVVCSWVQKLVRGTCDEGLFDNPEIHRVVDEKLVAFKHAWLDARQIAYSSMPGNVTHILWLLTTMMSLILPWEWVTVCQWNTWFPSVLLAISFFGIMKIANSMENPFGFDEDDIQLWKVAKHLDEEICLTMHYSLLDELGGENLYRNLMGKDMIFINHPSTAVLGI